MYAYVVLSIHYYNNTIISLLSTHNNACSGCMFTHCHYSIVNTTHTRQAFLSVVDRNVDQLEETMSKAEKELDPNKLRKVFSALPGLVGYRDVIFCTMYKDACTVKPPEEQTH